MSAAPLAALDAFSQFIIYRAVPSTARVGKTDKQPCDYRTGNLCNAHDPAVWTDRATATSAAAKLGSEYGVGFVLTASDNFFCIDIDNCATPDGWSPLALKLCAAFPGAAVEISISGRGLHIFGSYSGKAPAHSCKNTALSIEAYSEQRFIALGDAASAVGNAGTDCTAALALVVGEYFPPSVSSSAPDTVWTDGNTDAATDAALIAKMLSSKPSTASVFGGKATFADLWNRDVAALAASYPDTNGTRPYDASSADMGLANALAWWTGRDMERIKRLMHLSGLKRDKWEREDYLNRTIRAACARTDSVYQERPADAPSAILDAPASYKMLSGAELCNLPPMVWAVHEILPAQGLAAIYGAVGSGKSFVAMSLGHAVANGGDWFGKRVAQAPVTIIYLEGQTGLGQRVKALENYHKKPLPDTLRFVVQPFNFLSVDVSNLAEAIVTGGGSNGIVVIDTLNRAAPGADENSGVDMGNLIAAAKQLQTLVGGLVLLVHHSGKDQSKGLRGHSSLLAALDGAIEVRREGDRREWVNIKAKDAADGNSYPFKLEIVQLGNDDDGAPITSCVLVPENCSSTMRRPTPPKSGNQKIVWDAISELLRSDNPFAAKPRIPLEEAIDKFRGRLAVEPKRQSERCRSAITGLISRGLLEHKEGDLWMR